MHAKCAGISEEDARRAPLPGSPLMTVSGLVSHLHWVEYSWFQVMFLGEEDQGPWTKEDPDREMPIGVEIPLIRLLADYEAQCARYRELVASRDLDAAKGHDQDRRSRSRFDGSCSIWSRRPPGTTATSTSSGRWPTE